VLAFGLKLKRKTKMHTEKHKKWENRKELIAILLEFGCVSRCPCHVDRFIRLNSKIDEEKAFSSLSHKCRHFGLSAYRTDAVNDLRELLNSIPFTCTSCLPGS
jgi:hypothetical protein